VGRIRRSGLEPGRHSPVQSTARRAAQGSDSVRCVIKWLKDKLDDGSEPDDGTEREGGEVSEGPNSFSDTETSVGGADSVHGTPDATPSTQLGDGDTPPAPAAS